MSTRVSVSMLALTAALFTGAAFAHGETDAKDHTPPPSTLANLPAQTILQLADVVTATARFQDLSQALAEGYVDQTGDRRAPARCER